MKKTLVTLLALVFVLGIAGTAFAAPANPFVDVPAKHWAYGAVSKLVKAGVVDGYGDGTFRGDRTITRYEMAQIVAKAMAKSEKADAEMKALIDKLAVEFAAELNNLGVRVAKLEAKTAIGLTHESRIMWGQDDNKASDRVSTAAFKLRHRIYLSGPVNEKIDFGARIQAEAMNGDAAGAFSLNRAFFAIKDLGGIDKITVGRQPIYSGLGFLMGSTNGKDGVRVDTKIGDTTTFTAFVVDVAPKSEVSAANVIFNPNKDVTFNLGYLHSNINSYAKWPTDAQAAGTTLKGNAIDLGVAGKVGDFWLKGEFVTSKQKDLAAGYAYTDSPKAYAFEISNSVNPIFSFTGNMVNPMKAHTDAFALGYKSIQQGSLLSTMSAAAGQFAVETGTLGAANYNSATGFSMDNNSKGFYFEYQNVLSKGLVFSFDYADLKEKDVLAGAAGQKDKVWMGRLEFYF